MGLRITQSMTVNRALRNIQLNTLRLNTTREQLSTGQRVNRPSDDPVTFLRMLPVRNEKARTILFQENAVLAQDILNTAASAFEDAVSVMARAKEIAIAGANGALGDSDRKTLGATAQQLFSEMLSLANSKLGDRFLFGGSATSDAPFVLGSGGTLVGYQGDEAPITVEIAPGSEVSITSSGKDLFFSPDRLGTSITGNTGATSGTGTDSGTGLHTLTLENTTLSGLPALITPSSTLSTALGDIPWSITPGVPDTISFDGGPPVALTPGSSDVAIQVGADPNRVVRIDVDPGYSTPGTITGTATAEGRSSWDGGETWTALDFSSTNLQVSHGTTGAVLNLDATGIHSSGTEQVSFGGTYDAFNVLVALKDSLNNAQGLSKDEQTSRITALIGEIDIVFDQLLEGLRDLGARASQIDLTKDRMERLELTLEEALSRDRDIDISEVILRLNQQDVAFQSALAIGGRVLDQSLLDFL